jgi:hypothetical protein
MCYRKFRPWTDEHERRMLELRAVGESVKSIASTIKRTPASVTIRLSKLRKRDRGVKQANVNAAR